MKTRTKPPSRSTLHFRDGTKEQWLPQLAYAIWLAVLAVALRTQGDKRPVQPWDLPATISIFFSEGMSDSGQKCNRIRWPCLGRELSTPPQGNARAPEVE